MARLLYDLCADNDLRFSPFCWRVKLALAHKGLDYQTEPVRFTEKLKLEFSGQTLLPVLDDNGTIVSDSWAIAEYLEQTYPDTPTLFPGNEGKHMAKLTMEWMDSQNRELLTFIILDIFAKLNAEDQAYFADKTSGIEAKVVAAASERGIDGAAALAYYRSQLN